jgi:hypothetical protein
MNAISSSSRMGRGAATLGAALLAGFLAVLHFVRLVLFAVLATFEPLVRAVLCFACLACFGMSAFYKLVAPPTVHFPHVTILSMGVGAAVVVVFYEMIVRALQPNAR